MLLDLQLGVEPLGVARLLLVDPLGPGLEAAEANLRPAQRSAVEPQRGAREALEEGPVVADDDEGAAIAAKPVLQPVDRREIEMVGRLVHQQDVGRLRQRPGDRCPAPLATRGGGRGTIEVDSDLRGDRVDLVQRRRVGAGKRIIAQGGEARDRRVLLEQHHLGPRLDRPPALVGVDQPGQSPEQGRLAGAVAADERQPVSRPDEDVEAAEQPAITLDQAEIFKSEYGSGHGGQIEARAESSTGAGQRAPSRALCSSTIRATLSSKAGAS